MSFVCFCFLLFLINFFFYLVIILWITIVFPLHGFCLVTVFPPHVFFKKLSLLNLFFQYWVGWEFSFSFSFPHFFFKIFPAFFHYNYNYYNYYYIVLYYITVFFLLFFLFIFLMNFFVWFSLLMLNFFCLVIRFSWYESRVWWVNLIWRVIFII